MGKVVFNEDRLRPVFRDFYNIFGIHISIFEPPINVASLDEKFIYMNSVAYPFPGPSDFCRPLRKSRIIDDRCVICDENAVRVLMQNKKTYIYRCHLGLLEAMIPAVYDDAVVAVAIIGSVSGTAVDQAFAKQFVNRLLQADRAFFVDRTEELLDLIPTVKVIGEESFKSICRLIEVFLAGAFVDGTIIVHKGSVLQQFVNYVWLHIDGPVSLDKAAEEIGVTKAYLCHIVKKEFGVSFSGYVHREKIARASRLLVSTPMTVGEIAEMLGYTSAAYFTRVFKKQTGVLPSRYKKSNIVKK